MLFGAELEEWSTMVSASSTSVRMILGSYDFDPMYEVAPVSATVWFWGFLLTMAFILMNLIFAMIADYFHVIRESVGVTETVWGDSVNAAKDLWWRMGWRKINFQDGEYKVALLENPYNEVCQGLMEAAQVPASLERDAGHSCLGVTMGFRHIEAMSIEGLDGVRNAGFAEATSKGLQELGADIMAADHLLELVQPHVDAETKRKNDSEVAMVRQFLMLLRKHGENMDDHCRELEEEVTDDLSGLVETLNILQTSVTQCVNEFTVLKQEGIHSLAPPLLALPRPGTLAAREAQEKSLKAPGELLRAIANKQKNPERNGLMATSSHPSLVAQGSALPLMNAPNAMLALANSSHLQAVQAKKDQGEQDRKARALEDVPAWAVEEVEVVESPQSRKDKHRGAGGSVASLLQLGGPAAPAGSELEDNEPQELPAPGQPALPPPQSGDEPAAIMDQ